MLGNYHENYHPDNDDNDDDKYIYKDESISATFIGAIELIGAICTLPVTIALLVPYYVTSLHYWIFMMIDEDQ